MKDEDIEDLEPKADEQESEAEEPWPQWPPVKNKSLFDRLGHPSAE